MRQNPVPEVVGQLASGLVRVIAATAATRSKALPDVPAGGIRHVRLRNFGVVGISRAGGHGDGGQNRRRSLPSRIPRFWRRLTSWAP